MLVLTLDSSVEMEPIIQRSVDRSPALNSLVTVVSKVGELQMMGFLEQENNWRIGHYNGALVSLLSASQRLSVAADLIPKQTLDELVDVLHHAGTLLDAINLSMKQVTVASNETITEQFFKLTELVLQILDVERSIFGTGDRIEHPVLRRSWTLVGLGQLHSILIQRVLFSKILLALLQHELGGEVFGRDEAMWKGCLESFISKIGIDAADDKLAVPELNIFCTFTLAKDHLLWRSLWQMLLGTEFSWDKMDTFTWRGESNAEDLLVVKKSTLPVRVEESSTVWEFIVPPCGGFLGVDACVDITVKTNGSVEGLATMHYQVGEKGAQFACFISFKDCTGGFMIGCNAVSPGDNIKVWVTWPEMKRLDSVSFLLNVSSFYVVHDEG